jgi:hypothetical protein
MAHSCFVSPLWLSFSRVYHSGGVQAVKCSIQFKALLQSPLLLLQLHLELEPAACDLRDWPPIDLLLLQAAVTCEHSRLLRHLVAEACSHIHMFELSACDSRMHWQQISW